MKMGAIFWPTLTTVTRCATAFAMLMAFAACNDRYSPREGCETDEDCLGARVCEAGLCVDPVLDVSDADAGDVFDVEIADALPDVPPAEPRLELTPTEITLPGLPLGELTIVGLGVRNAGGGVLVVDAITQPELSLQVTVDIGAPPGALGAGDQALIPVRVFGALTGSFATEIEVASNAGDARVAMTGAVTDGALGCVLLEPDGFAFGEVAPGELMTGDVRLTNCGDTPLPLEVDGGGDVTVAWDIFVESIGPGDQVRGTFEAIAPNVGGPFEFFTRVGPVELGDGFRVSGTVDAPRRLCLEPVTPVIAFGEIDVATERTRTALVRNCGTVDLIVLPVVRSSEAFSTPEGAFTIEAGDTVEFPVFFEPPAAEDFEATLLVEQTDGFTITSIDLTGTGAEELGPTPCVEALPPFADFGELQVGETAELDVRVRNCGDVPLLPVFASLPLDSGFFASLGSEEIAPGTNFFIRVSFDPQSAGEFATEMVVSFEPEVQAVFALSGSALDALVGPILEFETDFVDFGTVQQGDFVDRDVLVCNVGDETLTLAIQDGPRIAFSAVQLDEDALEPMECATLTIRFQPFGLGPGESRPFSDTLRLDTNASFGTNGVRVSGVGSGGDIPEPCLELIPSPAVQTVQAGEEVITSVEMINCGSLPLAIDDVALGLSAPFPASFSVDAILAGDDLVLDVGETGAVILAFGATRAGEYTGEVVVVTDQIGDSITEVRFIVTEEPSTDCLEVEPASLNLGRIGVGEETQRAAVVVNCGRTTLALEPFIVGDDNFRYSGPSELELEPGEAAELTVVFGGEDPGTFRATLRVVAPGSDLDTITIPVQVAVTDSTFCPDLRAGGSTSANGPFRTSVSTLEEIEVFLDAGYPVPDTAGVVFQWTLVSFEGVRPPDPVTTDTLGRIRLTDTLQGVYQYEVTYVSPDGCVGADTVEVTIEPDTGIGEGIRIVISWRTPGDPDELTDPGTDVDMHFARRNDSLRTDWNDDDDCYFGNRETDWGVRGETIDNGRLLRDEVDGIGPEIIVLEQTTRGERYLVAVHYFSDDGFGPSDVTLRIFRNGIQRETATRRLEESGDVWLAAEIRDLGETIDLLGLDNFRGFPPANQPLP
ncbi:MAG: hypothetical protein ACI81R_001117 [Bradymonadia bacterium]|jgi:hypothetical protein